MQQAAQNSRQRQAVEPAAHEVGYILKAFLRTSETFITNEIALLESAGVRLSIFSIKRLEGQQQHGAGSRIEARVTYLPEAAPLDERNFLVWLRENLPRFIGSHLRLCRLRPRAYFQTLAEALWMCVKYRDRRLALPRKVFLKEFLQAGFIALKVLESGRIRHLHAHFCHGVTTVAMFASRLCGLPFSFTAHAKDIYQRDLNPGDLLTIKMRRARFVVTCTGANKVHLDRLRPQHTPLHTIYHGLDLSLFTPAAERPQQAVPVILSVGRMVEKKGFTYLIEACRMLKERGCDFKCRIVGGADKFTEVIKARISELKLDETVTLHPAVTQEELRHVYAQSTIFALPCQVLENGDRDGIPNVLVEAMAMKLPVVSTAISGIPELIADRRTGLLVPQKDAEALADAFEELLADAQLRERLGAAAREQVIRCFDAQENIRTLKALFDGCLASDLTAQTTELQINETATGSGHLSLPV
ncbi:MAG TPA: glycosyltransferase family 4 protein [Blastocatellia bacterium]|nr:glycosyltransferase family 4 protein [Blastocatellia bacterium]